MKKKPAIPARIYLFHVSFLIIHESTYSVSSFKFLFTAIILNCYLFHVSGLHFIRVVFNSVSCFRKMWPFSFQILLHVSWYEFLQFLFHVSCNLNFPLFHFEHRECFLYIIWDRNFNSYSQAMAEWAYVVLTALSKGRLRVWILARNRNDVTTVRLTR